MDNRFFLHEGQFKILPHPHYSPYSSFPLHPTIEQVVPIELFPIESFRSLHPSIPIDSFPPTSPPGSFRPRWLRPSLPFSHPYHFRSASAFLGCHRSQALHSLPLRSHLSRIHSVGAAPSQLCVRPRFSNHAGRHRADSASEALVSGADRRCRDGGVAENERCGAVFEGFAGGSVGISAF